MFYFCHLQVFYDFKVVKSIKMEQNLLKNYQNHDAKNNRFTINGYDSSYTLDLTSVVSNYKSLLITTSE